MLNVATWPFRVFDNGCRWRFGDRLHCSIHQIGKSVCKAINLSSIPLRQSTVHILLMPSDDISMALFSMHDEQGYNDYDSGAGPDFDPDFSTSTGTPMQDFLSDEEQLSTFSQTPAWTLFTTTPDTPASDIPGPPGEPRTLWIIPAPLGPRNTVFFLDHTRHLAVTHYQTKDRTTLPTAIMAPQFLLQLYIRSNTSVINTRNNLKTIVGWCEQVLALQAINHLLHELRLSGISIRVEMYDGLENFKASLARSTYCFQAEKIDFF
jgi:hypothetical protein